MKPADFLQQHSNEIALYDRMRTAIAECERLDEVKDIRDKAHAIQIYAAQAQNYEAEAQAVKIRLRAERRFGELYKESPKATGTRGQLAGTNGSGGAIVSPPEDQAPTLKDLGVSKHQAADWQKLAEIPEDVFEAKLNDSSIKPSTSELIDRRPPPGKMVTADVLYVWDRIRDFERKPDECLKRDPRAIFEAMTDTMQADIERIVPHLIPWLEALISRRECDEERSRQFLFDSAIA